MVAKLAISSTVVLTMGLVVLICFSVMGIRHYLTSGIDDDLDMGRDGIEQSPMTAEGISMLLQDTALLRAGMQSVILHGNVFTLVDANGTVIPFGSGEPEPVQRALAAAVRGSQDLATDRGPRDITLGGEGYRTVTAALDDGNFLVLAQPTDEVDDVVLKVVHLELVVGGVLVVLLGTFIYFGARWRLRPLEDMVETASGIAEGGPDRPNLSRRVAPRQKTFREVEQLRTALNAMLQQVESAFETREHAAVHLKRFVADASHELRTPLAAIRGYLQLYERGMLADEDERTRALTRMSAETERMARLVDELLALARLDQRPQLRPRAVDLTRVVREAAADLRAQQPGRRVLLEVAERCDVLADEALLRQIVGNLLTNVRVHTPESAGVWVSVSEAAVPAAGVSGAAISGAAVSGVDVSGVAASGAAPESPAGAVGGRRAVLTVRDDGPGMRTEDADRIFDRFFRAAQETSGAAGGGKPGSGLGMAVVSAAVAAHGGEVRVETEPGKGLAVVVELPLACADLVGTEEPAVGSAVRASHSAESL
ncbi:sensor histidine kinase [Yinghuangia sp. YIM S09857]|uniref:sensor histidine kinase n=1 Tax=Yinghuangia sp. YIM S09857 TaxID=3436929 RepID=UPI003F53C75A